MTVAAARTEEEARAAVADADAFFGTITPAILASAGRLRWIQTPMAGLERYFFPALIEHPVVVTNMRGIFHDMIPDHVLCYILCFARDMHTADPAPAGTALGPQGAQGGAPPEIDPGDHRPGGHRLRRGPARRPARAAHHRRRPPAHRPPP